MDEINGIAVGALRRLREDSAGDPSVAARGARVVAEWTGGDRSRVRLGEVTLDVAGPGHLDPMQLVLAALASCEVDTVATRAALLGLRLDALEVEVSGTFDLRAYVGVAGSSAPGYPSISCSVRIRAPGATGAQLDELRRAMLEGSPVADTLSRSVRLDLELTA